VRRKQFFFEKKNQKTFARFPALSVHVRERNAAETDKSFLVLFFKKELLSCCADVSLPMRVGISRTRSSSLF
jgi:hypothetical protein